MNAVLNSGQLPQHTPEFMKERKFLVIMPLLVIPFLTMAFWALGGGKRSASAFENPSAKGLNASLPHAQFKDQKARDKMGVYQTVQYDSARSANDGVSESFARSMGLEGNNTRHMDSAMRSPANNFDGEPASADINEAKIRARLAEINHQLTEPAATTSTNGATSQPSGSDVRRLELMMKATNNQAGNGDPELQQLTQLLRQIEDIQNPDNASTRLRNESMKNHGRVYPVITATDDNDDNSGAGNMMVSYTSSGGDTQSAIPAVSNIPDTAGNAVQAVIHEDQTLVSGAVVKLRLLDDIYVNGKTVSKGSFIYGICALNNERLNITIASIRSLNSILPVSLSVYDLDGMEGLYVPGSIGRDAVKNGAGDAMQSLQLMATGQSAATQAASAGVEAAKGLFNHKVKQIKIKVKAGYKVLLKDANNRDN